MYQYSRGGVYSEDVTASTSDILKGKTTITNDSDDEVVTGTLELTGNATTGNVEKGITFYNTNAKSKQTGSLRNVTSDTTIDHSSTNATPVVTGDAAYVSANTDGVTRAQIRFNQVRGVIEANTLIGIDQNAMASAGGLSAAKILAGQSGFGIAGTATSDATAATQYILGGYSAYVNGKKINGGMKNKWYEASVNLTSSDARKVVPSGNAWAVVRNTDNVVRSLIKIPETGYYTDSTIIGVPTSQLAANGGLTSAKLLKGQSAFNIVGTATSDANAGASHILSGKTAWVNGVKITGNIASQGGQTITPKASSQTISCNGKYMTGNIIINGYGDRKFSLSINITGKSHKGGKAGYLEIYAANPTLASMIASSSKFEVVGYSFIHINSQNKTYAVYNAVTTAGTEIVALDGSYAPKLKINSNGQIMFAHGCGTTVPTVDLRLLICFN